MKTKNDKNVTTSKSLLRKNDPVIYVNHILDSAIEYIRRAKESIYIEYGYGKNTIPPGHPELLKNRANDTFHFDIKNESYE